MNKFNDIVIQLINRFSAPVDKDKSRRKSGLFSDGLNGNQYVIMRLILGAVILLTASMPFIPKGIDVILQIFAFWFCAYDLIIEIYHSFINKEIFTTNLLIIIAGILALCVGKNFDAVLFILIYRAFLLLEKYIIKKIVRSMNRVLNLGTREVKVYSGDKIVIVPTADVKVGEYYMVEPGDLIPLDGIVVNGASEIDTEPLTGDPTIRKVHKGSAVLSGYINVSSMLFIRATADLENSVVTKRLRYVETYDSVEQKIKESLGFFNTVFTPIACGVALLIGIVPPIIIGGFVGWLYKASILLALACPLQIFASCAIAYLSGFGGAADNGILFKDKEAIDAITKTECVIFDKNGTLSTGKYTLTSIEAEDISSKELLELASYAFAKSEMPMAKAILANVDIATDEIEFMNYHEEPGKGCIVRLLDGRVIIAGNEKMLELIEMKAPTTNTGDTVVYVFDGRDYMGSIHMSDKLRYDSRSAIDELRELDVRSIGMMSGDSINSNEVIVKNMGIDNAYVAFNAADKIKILERVNENLDKKEALVYVGNGYDDSEALEYANIGVAMNGLISDKAIECSDIIFIKSEPSKVGVAIKIAKTIKRNINVNVAVMTAVTAFLAMLTIFNMMSLWSAMVTVGIASILVLLNAARVYRVIQNNK